MRIVVLFCLLLLCRGNWKRGSPSWCCLMMWPCTTSFHPLSEYLHSSKHQMSYFWRNFLCNLYKSECTAILIINKVCVNTRIVLISTVPLFQSRFADGLDGTSEQWVFIIIYLYESVSISQYRQCCPEDIWFGLDKWRPPLHLAIYLPAGFASNQF